MSIVMSRLLRQTGQDPRARKGADLQQASGQNVKAGGIAYVEAGTGNVDRFPLEALIAGSLSVDPAGEPR